MINTDITCGAAVFVMRKRYCCNDDPLRDPMPWLQQLRIDTQSRPLLREIAAFPLPEIANVLRNRRTTASHGSP
eukprot:1750617-Rhodomonas_salina.1